MRMKKFIKFWWLLPAIYLAALLIQVLGIISGAGHSPPSLRFLFHVVAWPSYVVNALLPGLGTRNPAVNLVLFVVVGLLTYGLLGAVLDVALKKYRQRLSGTPRGRGL